MDLDTDMLSVTSGGEGSPTASTPSTTDSKADTPEHVSALVKKWNERVNKAKTSTYEKAFKRARECIQLAKDGATQQWVDGKNVTVPLLNRHINTQVSVLYAKDPKVRAKRKKRLMHTVWDGTKKQLDDAQAAAMQAAQMGAQGVMDPNTGAPMQPDPQAMAIVQDAMQVNLYNTQVDLMGKTLEALFDHFMSEQSASYRSMFKAQVRRTKVVGWSWVKLGFQREMQPRPEGNEAAIDDATDQLAALTEMLQDKNEGDEYDDMSAEAAQLKYTLEQLQTAGEIITREGPVLDFPRFNQIIVDPAVTHMKTLAGARWLAHEFMMSCEDVERIYKVDLEGQYSGYTRMTDGSTNRTEGPNDSEGKPRDCLVREIWDKELLQVFTIVDGHPDFVKPPAEPDVKISRFFTTFPLIFNEIEPDDDDTKPKFPPSDVWLAKDSQFEYNRARNGLREHRQQNRPFYGAAAGRLEKEDKAKLAAHDSGEIIEILGMQPGEKLEDIVRAFMPAPIDPKLYDVEANYNDLLRTVGTQEADLGNPAGKTATEVGIAENSRKSTVEDNVDDIDEMLSQLARAMGELMLLELSKDTVIEIVGPGAVWPDMPPSRADAAKELTLDIKAGSTGRPNKARDLQAMSTAWPIISALPGMPMMPLVEKLCDLLDIDLEAASAAGLPSITAINAMAQKMAVGGGMGAPGGGPGGPPGTPPGPGGPPNQQGGNGGQNAPKGPDTANAQGQGQMNPGPVKYDQKGRRIP
jgi:hypothetical protein